MKHIIALLLLVSASSSFAVEESADDIAKRVIVDRSSAHILLPTGPISYVPPRPPGEDQLAAAAIKAFDALTTYILSDAVPEKVRIAYAIRVLVGKRVPKASFHVITIDTAINDGYLKDGLILAARFAEIEKVEQDAAGQADSTVESMSGGKEKAKPESEKRP
jgi:hypothetical protein